MAAVGERVDPFPAFNFLIDIDNTPVAGFTEVGGLTAESDVVEYREGDDPATPGKLPGLRKYGNITLKRGETDSLVLYEWRKTTEDGATERRDGSIVLLNESREPVLRWSFINAWISKYEGPALNSGTSAVAIESMELAHEGLRLERP
jgi:phage tail-like protein